VVSVNPCAARIDADTDAEPPVPVIFPPSPPVALKSTRRKLAVLSLYDSDESAGPPMPAPLTVTAVPPLAYCCSVSVPDVSPLTALVKNAGAAAPTSALVGALPDEPPVRL